MRLKWMVRGAGGKLLVFFNGWGMDERPVEHMSAPSGCDLLMAFDYRDMEEGGEKIAAAVDRYSAVTVVAWSMGVWAAGRIFERTGPSVETVLAVNGTGFPVHREWGIPPDLYRATVEGFSTSSRNSFFRRMCGGKEALDFFRERAPLREIDDQRQELALFEERMGEAPSSPFTHALVGRRDRIMPVESQVRYWEGRAPFTVLEFPHYPFFRWRRWEDLVDDATADR